MAKTEKLSLSKTLEAIAYRHDFTRVFDDFLMIAVCSFSMQRMEKIYFETIKGYNKEELSLFAKALAALIFEYTEKSSGGGDWYDLLGQLFEEQNGKFTRDLGGQFFTPNAVCDLMAKMTYEENEEEITVSDPTCGSGRNLIAFDRTNANNRFKNFYVGMDLDSRCVKMSVLNLFLFGMRGAIIHMNTLSLEIYGGYRIYMPETGMGIMPLTSSQCLRYVMEEKEQPIIEIKNEATVIPIAHEPQQLKLFA